MNEELQKALADVLNTALSAKDFIMAELPDVIHQLLWWKGIESFLYMLLGLIIIYACYKIPRIHYKKIPPKDEDYRYGTAEYYLFDNGMIGHLFLCIPLIIGFCIISIKWLQILIAPKVYLLEYAASIAK